MSSLGFPRSTFHRCVAGRERFGAPFESLLSRRRISAERERFELSRATRTPPVFETGAFNHSATSPPDFCDATGITEERGFEPLGALRLHLFFSTPHQKQRLGGSGRIRTSDPPCGGYLFSRQARSTTPARFQISLVRGKQAYFPPLAGSRHVTLSRRDGHSATPPCVSDANGRD